jgi:UDP-2,3-diacylglucosamine pyrophosphatase LpxH/DNA-binding CsgD family transcriptional regulator
VPFSWKDGDNLIPLEIKKKCIEMADDGVEATEIYKIFSQHSNGSIESMMRMIRNWRNGYQMSEPAPKKEKQFDIIQTLKKGIQLTELCERLNMSPKTCESYLDDLRSQGYNIVEIGGEVKISNILEHTDNRLEKKWNGERIIRFGLMGDTQINSKYTQITYLHKFYDICQSEGIDTVYMTGDIDDGEKMRPGHEYELYNHGADNHIEEIVRVYPKRDGIKTYFITGNHDAAYVKLCGLDIGHKIAEKRSDMIYLGYMSSLVSITPNCTLELRHPIDGTAYAISYKIQKMIEAMSGGEKPNILAVGHYHKAEYLFYRNVHAIQTGCFQAQSNWMKGKQISAHMGGWIIEVHVDEEGTITRIKQEFIPVYKAIVDDWKNWR